jgi:hypothetical protein
MNRLANLSKFIAIPQGLLVMPCHRALPLQQAVARFTISFISDRGYQKQYSQVCRFQDECLDALRSYWKFFEVGTAKDLSWVTGVLAVMMNKSME